jgi:hypothetical protein
MRQTIDKLKAKCEEMKKNIDIEQLVRMMLAQQCRSKSLSLRIPTCMLMIAFYKSLHNNLNATQVTTACVMQRLSIW